MTRPSVLIENWLPIEAIGAESMRERGASSALPPLYFLHVWWARRPLTTSRAAILAGVLPQWSPEWPEKLRRRFPDEQTYHNWYLHLIGVRGDPIRGMKIIQWAKARGEQLKFHPYGGAPRAFTISPDAETLETLANLLETTWGSRELSVLDPFAGGGSIPFEALRYGFPTYANDLNPVAATILKATLDYPAKYGPELAGDIKKWGQVWANRVKEKLEPFFPKTRGENIYAYLWTRTISCPTTGKPIPLSPNWWLQTIDTPVAAKLICNQDSYNPRFEIVTGAAAIASNPDTGTYHRGIVRSPWTGETLSNDYLKVEAQAGRMGQMIYAIVDKVPGKNIFRAPTDIDIEAANQAEARLQIMRSTWLANDILPQEAIPLGDKTSELHRYGMQNWDQVFSPRQLMSLCTFLETKAEICQEMHLKEGEEKARAIETYFGLLLDIAVVYNNRGCRFNPDRGIRSRFDRHDFAFYSSHAEFDAASNLLQWAVYQQEDAYTKISKLIYNNSISLFDQKNSAFDCVQVTNGAAQNLTSIANGSIYNITVDPPYYDNVQYAELSDFFYVWLKRSVGPLYPDFFKDELTNKDDEAVANQARFASISGKKKALAEQDYERKMAAAFREMHRVLHPDGVLTVMFTHKRVEAWDILATALVSAGFTIQASWPVHTESEHSLHQAKKNAASSTILLVCRKRETLNSEPVWWDDIQEQVRRTAREKAAEFSQQGIGGVDLYISTFGPTLSIISQRWPVLTSEVDPKTGQPRPLRPETALDLAREEVVRLRKQGLLLGREVQFDPVTDWYLMAWDAFKAEQFPYDEGRKLAIALGIDLDTFLMQQKRIAVKKGEYIVLQMPQERRKKGMVDDEITTFPHLIDAVHTAMMVYEEDGSGACNVFLMKTGYKNDGTFKAVLQAMLNAIPRNRIKGKFVRPEAEVLENMRLAFFEELQAPVEEEPELPVSQPGLFKIESFLSENESGYEDENDN